MKDFKIYLSAPPELAAEAARHSVVCLEACRVGRSFRPVLSRPLPGLRRPALLRVSCSGLTGFGPHEGLSEELCRVCLMRGYSGAVLDLPRPTPPLLALAAVLSSHFSRHGLALYLPEPYSGVSDKHMILIPAQNLSGSYSARLERLVGLLGGQRLALLLDPRPTDHTLPARDRLPVRLSAPVPGGLTPERAFYSTFHEANYMTFLKGPNVHLILWDDPRSLSRKLSTAQKLGITAAFLPYADAAGMLDSIM